MFNLNCVLGLKLEIEIEIEIELEPEFKKTWLTLATTKPWVHSHGTNKKKQWLSLPTKT